MKKGFTLIELLAVIIILSIIGLITMPIAVNYITESRIATYKASVQTLIEAAKEYVGKNEKTNDFPEEGINITEVNLNLKKNNFEAGIIKRNENGEIEAVGVYNGEYCANGTKQNLVVEKVKNKEECKNVDASKPILKITVTKKTSTKIKVVAIAKDEETGIKDYRYCIGDECSDYITENNYEFKGLTKGTEYEITVEVRNNNYGRGEQYTEEVTTNKKTIKVKTNEIEEPEFKISSSSYATSKEITIIYPNVSEGYKKIYQMIDKTGNIIEEKEVEENEITIIINKNGKLKASIIGNEEEISSELEINGIDDEGPEVYVIMTDKWESSKQIEVIAEDKGSKLATKAYSYDGGKSWGNNNRRTYTENTTVKLVVKDRLNNQTNKFRICKTKDKNGNPQDCGEETDEIIIDKIDTEKPICSLIVTSGEKGTSNWYRSDVEIGFESTDDNNGSGVVESKINTPTLTQEGVYEVEGTVKDAAGNEGYCTIKVKIDKTKPTCGNWTGESTSWTKSDRTIYIGCTDNLSKCTSEIYKIKTYTSGTTKTEYLTKTITDGAGNSTTCSKTANVYVDKEGPVCGNWTGEGTSWTNGNRIINVGCTDTGSGCTKNTYTTTYNSGTISTANASITITDKVGNSTTCKKNVNVYVDKDAPKCTSSGGSSTWTNASRTLIGTCQETTGSGCKGNVSKVITDEGEQTNLSPGKVSDNAGNETQCPANQTVKIDKTKPTCGKINISGTKGNNGWYTSNVTITKDNGSDTLSGHASTTLDTTSITKNTSKEGTTVTLTTKDKAGNTCTTTKTIKIDKTKPTCGTINISGTKGDNGWYTSNVTITKDDGSDSLSGHASTTLDTTSITKNTSKEGTTVTLTTKDKAGNTCTKTKTVKIDKTEPTLSRKTVSVNVGYKDKPYVKITYEFSDSLSGISGYYWGTSNPSTTNVDYTSTSKTSIQVSINSSTTNGDLVKTWGTEKEYTYYFAVKDKAGNITVNKFKCLFGWWGTTDSWTKTSVLGYTKAHVEGDYSDTIELRDATDIGANANGYQGDKITSFAGNSSLGGHDANVTLSGKVKWVYFKVYNGEHNIGYVFW